MLNKVYKFILISVMSQFSIIIPDFILNTVQLEAIMLLLTKL